MKGDCPTGTYCLSGTADPTECAIGTFRATVGGSTNDDTTCVPCTEGNSCNHKGAEKVTAQCASGYFCSTRASSTTPTRICRNYDSTAKKCDFVYASSVTCSDPSIGATAAD